MNCSQIDHFHLRAVDVVGRFAFYWDRKYYMDWNGIVILSILSRMRKRNFPFLYSINTISVCCANTILKMIPLIESHICSRRRRRRRSHRRHNGINYCHVTASCTGISGSSITIMRNYVSMLFVYGWQPVLLAIAMATRRFDSNNNNSNTQCGWECGARCSAEKIIIYYIISFRYCVFVHIVKVQNVAAACTCFNRTVNDACWTVSVCVSLCVSVCDDVERITIINGHCTPSDLEGAHGEFETFAGDNYCLAIMRWKKWRRMEERMVGDRK